MHAVLGLFSALSWGTADFLGGLASKKAHPYVIATVMELVGLVAVLVCALLVHGEPTTRDLVVPFFGGMIDGVAMGLYFRALSSGQMGVVSPLAGVTTPLVPIVVALVAGERFSPLVFFGVITALLAIAMISSEARGSGLSAGLFAQLSSTPARLAILAGVCFGVHYASLGDPSELSGLWPTVTKQAGALLAVSVFTLVTVRNIDLASLRGTPVRFASICGVLQAAGAAALMLGARQGSLAIVSVLAALNGVVPVVLSKLFLNEHWHSRQRVGFVFAVIAIPLLVLGRVGLTS